MKAVYVAILALFLLVAPGLIAQVEPTIVSCDSTFDRFSNGSVSHIRYVYHRVPFTRMWVLGFKKFLKPCTYKGVPFFQVRKARPRWQYYNRHYH